MKKRLLFAMMAMSVSASSFALSQGEYVYTPQGRFQVTGDNLNANSSFQDMSGWTVISASADKTLADQFNINGNGYAEGINSVVSLNATAGEGMYFKFEPTDASLAYVVSFKMKGTALASVECRIPGDGNKRGDNLVKVEGNSDGVYSKPDGEALNDVLLCNTGEVLSEEWQTFNYAIVGDGTARTYFISFTGMATSIEIADLQIAPAMQFADLRLRDAMLEKMNAYKNCYNWSEDLLADFAMTETIENLQAIGDEAGQADLDDALMTAEEVLTEFLNQNMDDYLATSETFTATISNSTSTPRVDNKFNTWYAKIQKANTWGDWTCLPGGRGFWENESQGASDFGHFAGNTSWCGGSPDAPMGIYMQKTLDPGAYVFSVEGRAALREDATSSSWTNNDGWNPAYGVAYVVKVNEGADPDTIASKVIDLDALVYTTFTISATVAEAGTYEIGFKGFCKDEYKSYKNGSVLYIKNASLWGKNNNKYNQKQLGYESDVREQITTGRTQLTTATTNIADPAFIWGKAELQACVDSVETKIAAYELLDQDAIIATYDNYDGDYAKSTSSEDGILVYEVYQAAVRDIIAANRKFTAVNDTLASIQKAIDAAEAALELRVYGASTGKDALQSAIGNAKDVQTQMKAADYSEDNANTIVTTNEALYAAIDLFKVSVPASAATTIVDIDFEQAAVMNEETQLYSVTGAQGSMEFSGWSVDGTGNQPFEQGYWSNGEQMWKGYIRVGNGTGTVKFDPTEAGSMGTNILKVSFDFFLQGLSGRNIGFFLKDETGEVNVAGFFANYYNNTIDAQSNLPIDLGNLKYASGGNYNNVAPEGAEGAGDYTCAKNSFEVILDFGEGSMYATTTSAKGTAMTQKIAFDGTIPYSFVLQCNYNNNDRRAWFDNLKIERVAAGAAEPFVDAIQSVKVAEADGAIYNLNGMRVANPTKGLYIVNGKKVVIK